MDHIARFDYGSITLTPPSPPTHPPNSITPILWGYVDFPRHLQLRGIITRSLHDIDQSVRRSTGQVLLNIVEILQKASVTVTPWLVLMCERGMTDPVGELRGNAVSLVCAICEKCKAMCSADPPNSPSSGGVAAAEGRLDTSGQLFMDVYLLQCKLLPIATRLAEDKSPNVRLAVAGQCDRLLGALGAHWIMVLIDLFQGLLSDEDERVRTEAVYCTPRLVARILESCEKDMQGEVMGSLFLTLGKMLTDKSAMTRVALATGAGQLLVGIAREGRGDGGGGVNPHIHFVDESILPVVQRLLHDPDPSVCSNALRAVANASQSINAKSEGEEGVDFVPVLKEKQVMRLLPTLTHLSTNSKWRVRRSAVEVVPALVKSTAGMKARAEIGKLVVDLLTDRVAEVRKAAR